MLAARHRLILLLAIALLVMASASPVSAGSWEYVNYTEDYVDQISDLHPPDTDIGTHSDFVEMQDKDGTFDTLTEVDTGGSGIDESLNVNAFSNDYGTFDTHEGASPYLDAQDEPTNYIHEAKSSGAVSGWYDFENTAETTSGIAVTLYFWCYGDDTNDLINIYEDWTGAGAGTHQETLTVSQTSYGSYLSVPLDTSTHTGAEINLLRVYFEYAGIGGGDDIYIDHVYARIEKAGGAVYDLDLEVGWTTADYDESQEYLCIFGGTQGSEALRVDVWDGAWTNVITDLEAGWNNVSVSSYLTDATFEIRFLDTTDDAVEADTWQVEGVLLQTWSYAYTETFFEGIGLADTDYVSLGACANLFESIGLAGTDYPSAGLAITQFESIGLADTVYIAVDAVVTLYESIGVAEVVLPAASIIIAVFEAIGLAATVAASKVVQQMCYEGIGVAGTVTTVLSAKMTVYEGIGISDTVANIVASSKTIFESIGIADIGSAVKNAGGTAYETFIYEAIGVAEVYFANVPTDYVKTLFESIGLINSPDVSLVVQSGGDATGIIPTTTTTTETEDSDIPSGVGVPLTVYYVILLVIFVAYLIKIWRDR